MNLIPYLTNISPPFEGGARGGKIVIPEGACPPWAGSGIQNLISPPY